MAADLSQIAEFFDRVGIKYELDRTNQRVITFISGLENYRDKDDDAIIILVVELDEQGQFIRFIAPGLYYYGDGPYQAAVLQTCLIASWQTKMVKFEYNPRSQEIRCAIEFPLHDATLTFQQFMRAFSTLPHFIDAYHPHFVQAIEHGELSILEHNPRAQTIAAIAALLNDLDADELLQLAETLRRRKQKQQEADNPPPPSLRLH